MGAHTISQSVPRLTAAQADELAQRQMKKHDVAIMLLHWFNAVVWLLELATGAALLTSSSLRVAPAWFVDIVQGLFGGKTELLRFHIAVGITWIAVFAVYAVFGFPTYVRREIWQREVSLDRDDIRWLRIRFLRMLKRSVDPLPPQGIYNAGQKLFAILVYAAVPAIMASGLAMTFHLGGTAVVGWAAVAHFAAVGAVLAGLMVHVYMAAVFPEEKPAFFSMITGNVNELYAYRHHFKWWNEIRGDRGRVKLESASEPGPAPPRARNCDPNRAPSEAQE